MQPTEDSRLVGDRIPPVALTRLLPGAAVAGESFAPDEGGRKAKIIEAFMSFARLLLVAQGREAADEDVTADLQVAAIAWNAANGGESEVASAEADLAGAGLGETWLAMYRSFVERKRKYYAHDCRTLTSVGMDRDGEGFKIHVEGAASADVHAASHSVAQILGSWNDPHDRCDCLDHRWAEGFGPADVPELAALASCLGTEENESRAEDDPVYWAPLNALRVLGTLAPETAVGICLERLDDLVETDDDWATTEFLRISLKVGEAVVAPLTEYLADGRHSEGARSAVCEILGRVAREHTPCRDAAIRALAGELAAFRTSGSDHNAFVIMSLVDAEAIEHEPLIAEALDSGNVDTFICGSKQDVLAELRGEQPPKPRARFAAPVVSWAPDPKAPQKTKAKERARAQRKREKQAKRKARKR